MTIEIQSISLEQICRELNEPYLQIARANPARVALKSFAWIEAFIPVGASEVYCGRV